MSFIEFNNVTYRYQDSKRNAIENLSIDIDEGEFIAVIGHNGSGKSTFAKLINGLLIPSEGNVCVNGILTSDEEKRIELLKNVGMIFQNPDNQIVASIVEEDVAFGPENLGVDPDEIRKRVDDSLKAVEMYDFRLKAPHNLSGGQKQRVAIASVLAMQPKCIVMDESTAMLDPRGRKEVINTVKKLNKELGITVIFITHFMDEAVSAQRVLVLDKAKIALDGTPKEVFEDYDRIISFGLDVPQPYELIKKLGIDECILTEEECADKLVEILGDNGKA